MSNFTKDELKAALIEQMAWNRVHRSSRNLTIEEARDMARHYCETFAPASTLALDIEALDAAIDTLGPITEENQP